MKTSHPLFSVLFAITVTWSGMAWAGPNEDLQKGVHQGNATLVEQAIRRGANPNAIVDKIQQQPLLVWAARWGNLKLIQVLLEKGANIEAKDKNGTTALMEAAINNHLKVIKVLVDKGVKLETHNQ